MQKTHLQCSLTCRALSFTSNGNAMSTLRTGCFLMERHCELGLQYCMEMSSSSYLKTPQLQCDVHNILDNSSVLCHLAQHSTHLWRRIISMNIMTIPTHNWLLLVSTFYISFLAVHSAVFGVFPDPMAVLNIQPVSHFSTNMITMLRFHG